MHIRLATSRRSKQLETKNILEARAVNKSYPGVQALENVDFELRRGEVQALVGQNGAGKSTFIEIIAGAIQPDSGQIFLDGKEVPHLDPSLSIEEGVQTVHQENQLVEELTVAENVFLYNLPQTRFGFVNLSICVEHADALFRELGIDIKSHMKLSQLTFVERKLISIAKAFSRKARILILDEPTASLDDQGKKILFDIIRRYTEKGLSTIYISHNLGEIFEVCDRATVFKDGKLVNTHQITEIDMNIIVQEMIGRASSTLYAREKEESVVTEKPVLEVQGYGRAGVVKDVSFSVKRGEIFGLGGLVGAGRTELARMIFGLDPKDRGKLIFEGKDITPESPNDAIKKGLGYLTEDRKENGLVLIRPIFENVSVVRFAKERNVRLLNLGKERTETKKITQELDVKTPSISQMVINLSGGNQQKVVMAKWLYAESEIIIFDEPTVGVDVGSKSEIYRLIDELAKQGKVIIMISSDNMELLAVCDRVGIMRSGRLVTILDGERITEENVLKHALGVTEEVS